MTAKKPRRATKQTRLGLGLAVSAALLLSACTESSQSRSSFKGEPTTGFGNHDDLPPPRYVEPSRIPPQLALPTRNAVLPHHFASPDEIIKPVVQFKVEPEYSQEAREARINGRAVVWFIVGVDGVPSDIRVLEGLGYGLDENIVKAVERWRFTPAQRGGVPVRWFGKAEVNFQIPSS